MQRLGLDYPYRSIIRFILLAIAIVLEVSFDGQSQLRQLLKFTS